MKRYALLALLLFAVTPAFSQKKGKEKQQAQTDSVTLVTDSAVVKTDSVMQVKDTVAVKTDTTKTAATTAKTDSVAKTTTATKAPAAKSNTAQMDSLMNLNNVLTAKFNTVNVELEKYRGVYVVIKEKVLKRDFDPEKFAQIVDSLAANRDSTAMGMAAMSTAMHDSLATFKKDILELKAKVDAAKTEEAIKARLVDELKTLKELLDAKILTQVEFDIKKAAVLRKWE